LLGREENQRLELKEALDGIDPYELAKDLSSMANADGGYFIVGAVQDKKDGTVHWFQEHQ
jgi:predicted HTH transcriptional regulator